WQPIFSIGVMVAGAAVLATAVVVGAVRTRTRGAFGWAVVRLAAVALLVLVAARPAIPAAPIAAEFSATDVYFVVDTTASMGAVDGPGGAQRLEQARADLVTLADDLSARGARLALITFDSEATVVVPLTSNGSAVARAASLLRTEATPSSRGTSIGAAVPLLVAQLSRAHEVHVDRAILVVYLGDGEHTASAAPASFAQVAPLLQGAVVIGYGTTEGAPMVARPRVEGEREQYVVDPATGQRAESAIDFAALDAVAGQLGATVVIRDDSVLDAIPAPSQRLEF